MAKQGGFGVELKITISTTLTVIANLLDVDFPKFKKFLAESTSHSSTDGFYEAIDTGKRRGEPFRAVLGWDDAETTHAAILTAFAATAAVAMSIEDPAGQEVITFSAHIEEISRLGKQEDMFKAEVMFHPTGKLTITT